jgi:rSAM/selenodomain-associated transferase 1
MRSLVVFARAPERGRVKTRLAAALGDDAALSLYRAFLEDTCALAAQVCDRGVLAVAGDSSSLQPLAARHGLHLTVQDGADLGARMEHAIARELAHGPVCIIGSDAPSLPVSLVEAAFERLADHELVVGPSTDGGYWLIGATRAAPELFSGVHWGTETVLEETLRRLEGRRAALAPFWYDVDEPRDLALLRAHLPLLGPEVAPATRAALAALGAPARG